MSDAGIPGIYRPGPSFVFLSEKICFSTEKKKVPAVIPTAIADHLIPPGSNFRQLNLSVS